MAHVFYDAYDLLELFGEEPVFFVDEEIGICTYSSPYGNGIRISLYISPHEEHCAISLYNGDSLFFTTDIENVEYLRREDNRLRIHQKDSSIDYLIWFSPNPLIETRKVSSLV